MTQQSHAKHQFLNEHCGTHRTAGGLLTDQAGRVLDLDTLASNFFSADIPSRSEVLAKAKEYVSSLGATDTKANTSASYYIRAMERVMEKGEAWVTKEQARSVARLQSMKRADQKDCRLASFPFACPHQA
jgi:protein disulfide-isomerase A6